MAPRETAPSWIDVKTKLATSDHAGLLSLVQDLYAASRDSQAFLHARLHLGDAVLEPYNATIDRWLWPMCSRTRTPRWPHRELQEGVRHGSAVGGVDGVLLQAGHGVQLRCRDG